MFGQTAADIGSTIAGFAITFLWTGAQEGPGSQLFDFFDVDGIYIATAETQQREAPPVSVPEPSTGILLGLGLVAVILRRRFSPTSG